ncbi:aminotransferase class I/II-fold pyridoxal phosphate-dependent enzyme [Paenibacillus ihumii]|uniref:aminotransferase class I/II-fold pyridoxal phosphate-dependent enzyme n=1 Tax=Paenibacillus ihumii TaxID=687436 RepID=UPI0006D80817|nr:aminotransferase class I/II-fold pyridoxal phosphate-dependent enzyme [Paenibacillus ihumii]
MSEGVKHGAPLYEALLRYKKAKHASFHVPGHKNGQAYRNSSSGLAEELTRVMEIDVTEITGTDDLHHPEGVIKEAQQRAASFFGAEETYFLVGGSTAGNLALILSVCTAPGDVLLVQRNVHKSVIHGLMLAQAQAVFLAPQLHGASGLATIPSAETVREALRRYPGAKGLLVTHPNYYGMGASLAELAELCHANGVPLLVDEAHGAHYGLHPALPVSALAQGADGVVQSTHKMLSVLTMGAMLHVQGRLLNRGLLRQRLAMVQSSSPSYPIMASLDLSRHMLEEQGHSAFNKGLAAAEWLRQEIHSALPRFGILQTGASGEDAAYTTQDPFKLVLYDAAGGWSGYELQAKLEAAGCIPEMSDERFVVLALSLGTTEEDAQRLYHALKSMADDAGSRVATGILIGDALDGSMIRRSGPEELELGCGAQQERMTGCKIIGQKTERQVNQERKTDCPADYSLEHQKQYKAESKAQQKQDHKMKHKQEPKMQHNQEQKDDGPPASASISTWNIKAAMGDKVSRPVPFSMYPRSQEEMEAVSVEASQGRVAAEMIIPYPPGIPLLYPGEAISERAMNRLKDLRRSGAKCQGAADSQLNTILVYKHLHKEQTEGGNTDEE